MAAFMALELYHSGYWKYLWKRLFTISAEDCWGAATKEVDALFHGFQFVNEGKRDCPKGRIFISKCVLFLCEVPKSRDADHVQCLFYDGHKWDEDEVAALIKWASENRPSVPEYAYDVHTLKGKRSGKTKREFFVDEFDALDNRQLGLFDGLVDELREGE